MTQRAPMPIASTGPTLTKSQSSATSNFQLTLSQSHYLDISSQKCHQPKPKSSCSHQLQHSQHHSHPQPSAAEKRKSKWRMNWRTKNLQEQCQQPHTNKPPYQLHSRHASQCMHINLQRWPDELRPGKALQMAISPHTLRTSLLMMTCPHSSPYP